MQTDFQEIKIFLDVEIILLLSLDTKQDKTIRRLKI